MSQRDTLREALLRGSDRGLYEVSADFHHAIDMLVAMLPSMVQGLAEESEKMLRERRHLDRAMQQAPPSFITHPVDEPHNAAVVSPRLYWYHYAPTDVALALGGEISAQDIAEKYRNSSEVTVFMATTEEVYGRD